MSLRLRLTLWYAALLTVSLLAFGSLLYVVLRASLEHQLDEALLLRATQITRNLSPGANGMLDPADLPSISWRRFHSRRPLYASFTFNSSTSVARSLVSRVARYRSIRKRSCGRLRVTRCCKVCR